MNFLNRARSVLVTLLWVLCVSSCGGGGGATPTVVSTPVSSGGSTANSSASSTATTVTSSTQLGISFSQSSSLATISTDSAGVQTVTLHNTAFQIILPDASLLLSGGTLSGVNIRTSATNSGNASAGSALTRFSDESSAGWCLVVVDATDSSLTSFAIGDMVASGGSHVLNIKEIRDRSTSIKTTSSTVYLQFFAPNTGTTGKNETIKVILN
jgi:hypothetical protein